MRILYHTHLYNKRLGTFEAVAQEISFLKKHFSGPVIQIDKEGLLYDRLPGWLIKKRISQLEKSVSLNHIYYPAFLEKSYFKFLKKPIIYSLIAPSLGFDFKDPSFPKIKIGTIHIPIKIDQFVSFSKKIAKIVVPDQRDIKLLEGYNIFNTKAILPGIDLERFREQKKASFDDDREELKLLVASAPWREHQFEGKGINLLLDLLQFFSKRLRIIFLWRGRLIKKIMRLIKEKKVENLCQVINKIVDPQEELARVHGTIAVFPDPFTAKAYPHSLIESLAVGKPVIASKNIYMASLIEEENCGVVVEPDLDSLKKGVDQFIQNYNFYQKHCRQVAEKYFSQERLLKDYGRIYEEVAKGSSFC